jgi:hypothetical protein
MGDDVDDLTDEEIRLLDRAYRITEDITDTISVSNPDNIVISTEALSVLCLVVVEVFNRLLDAELIVLPETTIH